MALDLVQVSLQIEGMASGLSESLRQRAERIAAAVEVLQEQGKDFHRLKEKTERSRGKTTWLVAGLGDGLSGVYRPSPLIESYVAAGADGSQIAVDRHSPVQCCLINVGTCQLEYGDRPQAQLESKPFLFYRDQDLYIDSPTDSSVRHALEGPAFAAKREILAVRQLADLIRERRGETPCLALLDASLILWPLAGKNIPDFVRDRLLGEEMLLCLDEMKAMAGRTMALASYVSLPRSTDVVNALRVGICPYEPTDCNRHCPPAKGRQCGQLDGVLDRDLFASLLAHPGSRSDVFTSLSTIVRDHYREHAVCFFYIDVGSEIARIEVPRWVAEDEQLLNLAHCLIIDQVRRGQGYPAALTEAHEEALVTRTDRESFWLIVEAAMAQRQIAGKGSEKSRSKSIRGI